MCQHWRRRNDVSASIPLQQKRTPTDRKSIEVKADGTLLLSDDVFGDSASEELNDLIYLHYGST